jgi:bisphosphoglycerate-dependent phosphoglycerate mutase
MSGEAYLTDVILHRHVMSPSGKAVLVSSDGNRNKAVWLPLSQIEMEEIDAVTIKITLPEWLAKDKGII